MAYEELRARFEGYGKLSYGDGKIGLGGESIATILSLDGIMALMPKLFKIHSDIGVDMGAAANMRAMIASLDVLALEVDSPALTKFIDAARKILGEMDAKTTDVDAYLEQALKG